MQSDAAFGGGPFHFALRLQRGFDTIEEEEDKYSRQGGRTCLPGIRNDDLFLSVRTERRHRGMGTDEITQSQLIVSIHKYGIDPEPRLTRPAYRRQPYRQRLGLSRNMQMQLQQVPGLQPFKSGS